ncbi:MAG: hypothetical protein ACOYJG_11010 [Prevotella sp.]
MAGINTQLLQTGYVRETDRKKAELIARTTKKKEVAKSGKSASHAARIGNPVASGAGKATRLLNKSGGSSDENRENEVGGSGDSEDEEEWKRRNGYSM